MYVIIHLANNAVVSHVHSNAAQKKYPNKETRTQKGVLYDCCTLVVLSLPSSIF